MLGHHYKFVGQSGIICCRRHVAKVPTAALKGILEQRQLKTVHLEAPADEPMSPTIGRPIDASLGGRVLEDAPNESSSRPKRRFLRLECTIQCP